MLWGVQCLRNQAQASKGRQHSMTSKTPPTPFTWDQLAPPLESPTKVAGADAKVDVLTVVPEPIRARAEASLSINTQRVAAGTTSQAARPRVDYWWDVQPVPDEERGKEFAAFLVKYAKYRPADKPVPHAAANSPKGQVTARPQAPGWWRKTEDGKSVACTQDATGAFLGVRYSVRPFEQRKDSARLPGTA
jgi:hypothetical protein